jgi:alpha-galactosidase
MKKNLRIVTILSITITLLCSTTYAQKFEELALTPPMGWNSWNKFGCDVSESLMREIADVMVSSGMRDAGYVYLNIDDCWHGERDSLGFIHENAERFPSGMKALADYVHSKGLKLGIYSDAGTQTCGGHPGSRGHEYQDAITYASWGIDYLKYDWCNTGELKAKEAYISMRDAIYSAGRPMVLSICEWGTDKPWIWGGGVGHLWRTTGDIVDCWDCELGHGNWSSNGIMRILDMQKDIRQYAGPGHWNDPDMMEVGNALTVSESRAHFSMWCMIAAPLIAGNDIRSMSKEITAILTDKEVIAVDQDILGVQGFKMFDYGDVEIWAKPLANNDWAICFLNRADSPKPVELNWKENPIYDGVSGKNAEFPVVEYSIRDLWAKKELGTTKDKFIATIPGHDVILVRLTIK